MNIYLIVLFILANIFSFLVGILIGLKLFERKYEELYHRYMSDIISNSAGCLKNIY